MADDAGAGAAVADEDDVRRLAPEADDLHVVAHGDRQVRVAARVEEKRQARVREVVVDVPERGGDLVDPRLNVGGGHVGREDEERGGLQRRRVLELRSPHLGGAGCAGRQTGRDAHGEESGGRERARREHTPGGGGRRFCCGWRAGKKAARSSAEDGESKGGPIRGREVGARHAEAQRYRRKQRERKGNSRRPRRIVPGAPPEHPRKTPLSAPAPPPPPPLVPRPQNFSASPWRPSRPDPTRPSPSRRAPRPSR